jgi:hypothetical protein
LVDLGVGADDEALGLRQKLCEARIGAGDFDHFGLLLEPVDGAGVVRFGDEDKRFHGGKYSRLGRGMRRGVCNESVSDNFVMKRWWIFMLLGTLAGCAGEAVTPPEERPGDVPPQGPLDRGLPREPVVAGSRDEGMPTYPPNELTIPPQTPPLRRP